MRDGMLEPMAGSPGDIVQLIRSGAAHSRADLVRSLGLAPSTVSLRVEALQSLGLLAEPSGDQRRGGRQPRRLEISAEAGLVAAIDVSDERIVLGMADLTGRRRAVRHLPPFAGLPADATAGRLWEEVSALAADVGPSIPFRGLAIGVPASVDARRGRIIYPSFRPDWHEVDFPALFGEFTEVPVAIENDANLVALAMLADGVPASSLVAVLIDRRIGSGIVSNGALHRGATGAGGEVSHTWSDGDPAAACLCGVPGCLESIASGAALIARLGAEGYEVDSVADLIRLEKSGEAVVSARLREAGTRIGRVLANVVNLVNPATVVLAGGLSDSPTLVASVRAEIFRLALPVATTGLEVRTIQAPGDAVIRGGIKLILDEVLAPARIDALARERAQTA